MSELQPSFVTLWPLAPVQNLSVIIIVLMPSYETHCPLNLKKKKKKLSLQMKCDRGAYLTLQGTRTHKYLISDLREKRLDANKTCSYAREAPLASVWSRSTVLSAIAEQVLTGSRSAVVQRHFYFFLLSGVSRHMWACDLKWFKESNQAAEDDATIQDATSAALGVFFHIVL